MRGTGKQHEEIQSILDILTSDSTIRKQVLLQMCLFSWKNSRTVCKQAL